MAGPPDHAARRHGPGPVRRQRQYGRGGGARGPVVPRYRAVRRLLPDRPPPPEGRRRGRKPRSMTPSLGDSVEILATSETMLGGINGLFGRVRALIQLDDGRTVAVIR